MIVLAHGLLSAVLTDITGYRFDPGMAGLLVMILSLLVPWFLLVLLIRRAVLLAVVERSTRPVGDMVDVLKSLIGDCDRMLGGSFRLLLVACFASRGHKPSAAFLIAFALTFAIGGNAMAMPSMHVGTSVLTALCAWTHARWVGWAMAVFALLIMLGSVQLGWHYAVDGYAGALIAWIAWRGGLTLARRDSDSRPV